MVGQFAAEARPPAVDRVGHRTDRVVGHRRVPGVEPVGSTGFVPSPAPSAATTSRTGRPGRLPRSITVCRNRCAGPQAGIAPQPEAHGQPQRPAEQPQDVVGADDPPEPGGHLVDLVGRAVTAGEHLQQPAPEPPDRLGQRGAVEPLAHDGAERHVGRQACPSPARGQGNQGTGNPVGELVRSLGH